MIIQMPMSMAGLPSKTNTISAPPKLFVTKEH